MDSTDLSSTGVDNFSNTLYQYSHMTMPRTKNIPKTFKNSWFYQENQKSPIFYINITIYQPNKHQFRRLLKHDQCYLCSYPLYYQIKEAQYYCYFYLRGLKLGVSELFKQSLPTSRLCSVSYKQNPAPFNLQIDVIDNPSTVFYYTITTHND